MTAPPANDAPDGSAQRRELAIVLGVVVLAALAVLFTASRTWLGLTVTRQPPFGPIVKDISGRTEFPAVTGFAVVAIIVAVLALVSGRWVRRGLAVLLLAMAVATAVYAGRGFASPGSARILDLTGSAVNQGSGTVGVTTHPLWPALTLVCAVVLAAAGCALLVRAGAWTAGLSAKYDAPVEAARSADPWRSLDRGEDPTLDDG